ncbi:MAG: hypothetical protein KY475_12060 [Planctomycetes bacterium]|nr:hypothetical protein [Planctomycetota bacterium]
MSSLDPAIQSLLSAQQGALRNQVAFTVAAKQLDATRQQGDAANALLEQAVQLSKALGAGENYDAQA